MAFKQYFDIPEDIIYLNTPGNGLLPVSSLTWRRQRDQDFFAAEGLLREGQVGFVQEGKKDFARFFHCKPNEVFCTPSFSWAFSTLLSGLPAHYSYLLLDEDYPSLNHPVVSRGFKHQLIPVDEHVEQRILEHVRANRPHVLLLSIVQYISGVLIDLQFVKSLKKEFPELIMIGDATQYFGTEPFDFENSGFDAVGASGYKWLMAGFGNGFMLIKEALQSQLYKTAQEMPRPKESFYVDKSILQIQYEIGHLDSLSFGTLRESLLFLEQLSLKNVHSHIQNVLDFTYKELDDRNLLLDDVKKRETRSPLINIQMDQQLYSKLTDAGVRCFPRGTGIRIGIHLYNDKQDIIRLLHIIDQLI